MATGWLVYGTEDAAIKELERAARRMKEGHDIIDSWDVSEDAKIVARVLWDGMLLSRE